MPVNIYEKAINPIVDLDTDVVVYVPGYATKGPSEPTLVTADNFTALFGDAPYTFKNNQVCAVTKNNAYAGRPDKSWLYAKGLIDEGLTVLYHRCNPRKIGYSKASAPINLVSIPASAQKFDSISYFKSDSDKVEIYARAKYFGNSYKGLKVFVKYPQFLSGSAIIEVTDKDNVMLESKSVSMNPVKSNYIGNVTFTYIDFYLEVHTQIKKKTGVDKDGKPTYDTEDVTETYDNFDILGLDQWYLDNGKTKSMYLYLPASKTNDGIFTFKDNNYVVLGTATIGEQEVGKDPVYLQDDPSKGKLDDEFDIDEFMTLLAGTDAPYEACKDTERYQSITYVTTGGYYQDLAIAGKLQSLAYKINSMALVDMPDEIDENKINNLRSDLLALPSETAEKAKSTMFYGADTYIIDGYRVVIPDSFGYLKKLGSNLASAIPAWIPVANNPQGVVSASATTRPISVALRSMMVTNDGISINPIIYKQNAGYTIMGNRTLYPTDSVPGPESYLNCQLVVNTVARAARNAANKLLIVSTNPATAFATFKSTVSKTCDKMLVNGDGLSAYNIIKLKKTQPGTIDVKIDLTVVEGIETFNITIQYQLNMEG